MDHELEILGLRQELATSRERERNALANLAKVRMAMHKADTALEALGPLAREYTRLKAAQESAVASNNRQSENFARAGHSGQYHSPAEVIKAVNEWRMSAITLAETVVGMVAK